MNSSTDWREIAAYVIAGIIVVGFMLVQWWVLSHPVALEAKEIVLRTLGTLDALLVMVAQYLFGSSRGSARKDETLRATMMAAQASGEAGGVR